MERRQNLNKKGSYCSRLWESDRPRGRAMIVIL